MYLLIKVQCIKGKSERYGRNLILEITIKLGKNTHQYITIKEFCKYTGLDEEAVNQFILD